MQKLDKTLLHNDFPKTYAYRFSEEMQTSNCGRGDQGNDTTQPNQWQFEIMNSYTLVANHKNSA